MMLALLLGVAFEGTVTDPDGNGIEDAAVVFYNLRFRPIGDIGYTDADGRFEVDLPEQIVRIRVLPPYPTTVSERWLGDTLRACSSPRVDPTQAERVDIALPWGGTVAGRLFTDARQPYAGVEVEVYPVWQSEVSVSSREVESEADGSFRVTGLPPDPDRRGFVLELDPDDGPQQFFDGGANESEASLIIIEDGGEVELGDVATFPGAVLAGRVLSADGPVEGADVRVSTSSILAATTDEQGSWKVEGVAPGGARIEVFADGYARTAIGDGPVTIEPVEVGRFDVVDHLEITLPREGRVNGRVPEITDGEHGGTVLLVGPNRVPVYFADVGPDGAFGFSGVFPGTYTVEVGNSEPFDELPGPLHEGGVPVQVTVEEGGQVDLGVLTVEDAARVSGTVLDDTGAPVGGAAVILQTNGGGPRFVDFTRTDGTYDVRGLPAATYDLQIGHGTFCEGDPTYVSIYYPSLVNPAVRRAVDLASGQVFDWDAVMPVDFDGDEMGDTWERQNGLDPTVDDADLDPDGDGFTNLDEYRLGTDPNESIDARSCSCSQPVPQWRPFFRR